MELPRERAIVQTGKTLMEESRAHDVAKMTLRLEALEKWGRGVAEDYQYTLLRGDIRFNAPEEPTIKRLCEQWGYGAIMDAAARLWAYKDPVGAHTTGPSRLTIKNRLSQARILGLVEG